MTFITEMSTTLDEARKVARMNEVISEAVFASPLDVLALGPGLNGSHDVDTSTDTNGGYFNNKGYTNQW